jgi:undecaprenyl diphosphate synthase
MWPDFDGADLEAAVAEFRRRDRRFGGVPAAAVHEDASAGVVGGAL